MANPGQEESRPELIELAGNHRSGPARAGAIARPLDARLAGFGGGRKRFVGDFACIQMAPGSQVRNAWLHAGDTSLIQTAGA